jgi:8-amino-7-oxononanoate synthase
VTYLTRVEAELAEIRRRNLYREIGDDQPRLIADFSSNDYLALSTDVRMVEALRRATRVGSGGARLLGGRRREHTLVEEDIAQWLGRERALLFSSGYMAALGAIHVLAELTAAIYSDALNHACLIDGVRLAKTPRTIFPHAQLPPKSERAHPALIVTESLFGMDGDTIDLENVLGDLHEDDVLLVDEAHALGVLGAGGAGRASTIGDSRVVVMGTLSKALGAAGGFIAGPAPLIDLLINRARTFIFDTALPPALALAGRIGVMLARTADDRRARLFANAARLRAGLRSLGVSPGGGEAPIVPILAGSERDALDLMQQCALRGVRAPAIRPPTVPDGASRLRISLRADHTDEHIDLLVQCLARTAIS